MLHIKMVHDFQISCHRGCGAKLLKAKEPTGSLQVCFVFYSFVYIQTGIFHISMHFHNKTNWFVVQVDLLFTSYLVIFL